MKPHGTVCQLLSHVWLFATPQTAAHQASLSTGFSRLVYWSGLPFPSPGELPDPGIEPMSPVSPALQAELHWAIGEADSILYRDTSPVTQRRQWHPTPVLLPGKSHGRRSQEGCSPWGGWVRHNWVTSLSLFTFMHWRRKWQPTPVFLPGESEGQGSLVGCCLWGHTESDTTEVT